MNNIFFNSTNGNSIGEYSCFFVLVLTILESQMEFCTLRRAALGNRGGQSFSTVFLVRVIVSNILLFTNVLTFLLPFTDIFYIYDTIFVSYSTFTISNCKNYHPDEYCNVLPPSKSKQLANSLPSFVFCSNVFRRGFLDSI